MTFTSFQYGLVHHTKLNDTHIKSIAFYDGTVWLAHMNCG